MLRPRHRSLPIADEHIDSPVQRIRSALILDQRWPRVGIDTVNGILSSGTLCGSLRYRNGA
jgi:hypothetical protein